MLKNEAFYVGRIAKTHGYKGGLTLKIDVGIPENYADLKDLFIEIDDNFVPFFLHSVDIGNGKLFIKIEDVNTEEEARELVGKCVYLTKDRRPKLVGNEFYVDEVVDFTVMDNTQGKLGRVVEVHSYPGQIVLRVTAGGKEILIPAVEPIIRKIDRTAQVIEVILPDGLLDIY